MTVYDWKKSDSPTLYPFSERIKVGVYGDLYLDLANRHRTLGEVLAEERQDALKQGMQQGLEALVNSLKTVLPDLDAVCQAVNQNEIFQDVSREESAWYYD